MMRGQDRLVDRTAGFTVLEMLVVLAILASLVALSQPMLRGVPDRLQLQTTARDILAALKSTRAAAIARNAETTLVFDLERGTFSSPAVRASAFPKGIELNLKVALLEPDATSRGSIRFFPDGSSTGADLVLTLRARSAKICVNWLTGIAHEDDGCGQQ
jgi:general secretion pathway protein H